jgi:hypothetical protein
METVPRAECLFPVIRTAANLQAPTSTHVNSNFEKDLENRITEFDLNERHLPGEQLPGEQLPGEQLPGKQLPGEQLPGEQLPGEQLPGEQLPGEQLPGEQLPGEQLPGEQLPGEQLPGEQLPGEAGKINFHKDSNDLGSEVDFCFDSKSPKEFQDFQPRNPQWAKICLF